MNWQNVVALAVFVSVCGLIAYVGDLLGRRMGKRRLSLFGLRPRHTAIVTTTITGMLIAAITIAVMATASTAVQQLALRGYQVLHELKETQNAYARAQNQLTALRGVAQSAHDEAALAVKQRNSLAVELSTINKAIARLSADLRANEAALARAEKQLVGAKGNLKSANRDLAKRRAEIARQKKRLDFLIKNQKWIEDEYGPKYQVIRERRIIFRPEEEVARKVIKCAQSKRKIRAEVVSLLDEADKSARAKGATVGDTGRAVGVLSYEVNGVFLEEDKNVDSVTDNILSGTGSVVLVLVSIGNAAEGEPTLVDFRPYFNRLVYLAGHEIAAANIDGTASRGLVFGELLKFLRYDVRMTAIKEGVIPTFDEDGQPSVGQIAYDLLFDLVDQIKSVGADARITASVTKDVWSSDGLDLTFDVRKSP